MNAGVVFGILIPFLGTSPGAARVFFMKRDFRQPVQRMLTGFAAGLRSWETEAGWSQGQSGNWGRHVSLLSVFPIVSETKEAWNRMIGCIRQ